MGQEVEPAEAPEDEMPAGMWAFWGGARGLKALGASQPSSAILLFVGRSHMMQRVLNTMQFLWVLGQASVDGLTRWLCTFTKHHHTMSDVLRAERYLLTQELLRVRAPWAKPPYTTSRPHSYLLPAEHMWSRAGPISRA